MTDRLFADHRDYLSVYFAEGLNANFHYFWLRHHCPCCVHPITHERILNPSKVPLDIRPHAIDANDDVIHLTWPGGHQSRFSLDFLADHRYSDRALYHKSAGSLDRIEVQYAEISADPVAVCESYLADRGSILIRACPLDTEVLVRCFAQSGFVVQSTHFGYIEDLKTDNTTNDNTDQLGYTADAVELHTDMPFIEVPPRYQILQCMQKADCGGESELADAKEAALLLRDLDGDAFETLTETPILFHRQQQEYESRVTFPILTFAGSEFTQVRTSYFTFAPLDMPFDRMEQWYRAYQKFIQIIEDCRYNFQLEPGDFVLYDNFRMLHGRRAFSGPRWMRGIYLNRE